MKKKYLLILFFVMTIWPVSAHAYIGLCCGKCGGNMPLTILGGGVPETNEFRFKFSPMYMRMEGLLDGTNTVNPDNILGMPPMGGFMAVPTSMDMYMTNLAVGYSFTDDLTGGLMFMWKKNNMDMKFSPMMKGSTGRDGFTMKSEGMADTMIMTKYRLFTDDPLIPTSQVSLMVGLSLPTGSIDEKNSNHPLPMRQTEQLPYGMQLGSGTFDPRLGLLYQGSSSPLWWGANLIYTGRWHDNSRDYRLGDEYRLDLYSMYQVRYDTVLQLQLNTIYWGKIRGEMDEVASGDSGSSGFTGPMAQRFTTPLYDKDNYGGKKVSLTAGVQWQPFPLHIVEFDVGVPLYQWLNGPQLEEDYRVMFTWYVEIPTPSSIRYTGKKKAGASRLGF